MVNQEMRGWLGILERMECRGTRVDQASQDLQDLKVRQENMVPEDLWDHQENLRSRRTNQNQWRHTNPSQINTNQSLEILNPTNQRENLRNGINHHCYRIYFSNQSLISTEERDF